MSAAPAPSRGRIWFDALAPNAVRHSGIPPSLLCADAALGNQTARFLAVVPDAHGRFPRARGGEVGLEEGWALAQLVREALQADMLHAANDRARRPIVAIVDVASQAYGRREELLGIHLACAAAVDAYAAARLAGHPVVALLVGRAMSGAFLAHGYQANRILALDAPGVMVHAMGKQAAARVTRRTVEELEELGRSIAPMSYEIGAFAQLGLVYKLIEGVAADSPSARDVGRVRAELIGAVADARVGARDLSSRLDSEQARSSRAASLEVRRRMAQQWTGA